jgi:hypothetical protein
VVGAFREALPNARIYLYDNNSEDRTVAVGGAAGAIVRHEQMQGKGNVVRRMFADVEADVYVLVDGDGTYDASDALRLISYLLEHHVDLVNGLRTGVHVRLAFFTAGCLGLIALSLSLAAPLAVTFIETGLVPRLPTAVLAMGLMVLAFLSLACGLVLDTVTRGRIEMKRLHYLNLPAAGESYVG